MNLNLVLERLPLARSVFLFYAIIGGLMLLGVGNDIEYGAYSDNLLAIGIACGALGIPRAIQKVSNGNPSTREGFFGLLENLPIPTLTFLAFLGFSSVALLLGNIEFGAFSDNLMKIGIACGVVGAAEVAEAVQARRVGVPPPPPPQQ